MAKGKRKICLRSGSRRKNEWYSTNTATPLSATTDCGMDKNIQQNQKEGREINYLIHALITQDSAININCMSSNLSSYLSTLIKAKHQIFIVQETKIKTLEIDQKLHYAWKYERKGTTYANPDTPTKMQGTVILLSASASLRNTERELQERGPR